MLIHSQVRELFKHSINIVFIMLTCEKIRKLSSASFLMLNMLAA